jgi:lipopolysaccharide biosynthesis regulator YciM
MGAALVLLLVALGAMAAGVLIGRYYVPDDRQLRRNARHSRAYMRALGHLIARDHDTVIAELRTVVEENIDDVEPYFALGAMFRARGEHERAIRVHQALAVRERERKKLRSRAMYELGMDFRAAGMPRRATRAMEEVLIDEPGHEGALRSLAALYEEQARFADAAGLWERIGKRKGDNLADREHHLYVAAGQAAIARGELDVVRDLLKTAQRKLEPPTAHFYVAAAELAAARGNHRGARERLKQALVADAALAPHLLPPLIAAERGLAEAGAAVAAAPDDLAEPVLAVVPADGSPTEPAHDGTAPPVEPAPAPPTTELAVTNHSGLAEPAPVLTIPERVIATLLEIERDTGPRLELALIRAQLSPVELAADVAAELATRFPDALASRVAAARIALAGTDADAVRAALTALAGEAGAIAWALHGRWQCTRCNHRPAAFSWRCGSCRRWGVLRMETGIAPPPPPPRERRDKPRGTGEDTALALLGARPDQSLPALATGDIDLAAFSPRRSLLGRVGGWASRVWRRVPARPDE